MEEIKFRKKSEILLIIVFVLSIFLTAMIYDILAHISNSLLLVKYLLMLFFSLKTLDSLNKIYKLSR